MMNKEYQRCVQLIEKYELAFHSEQFRILTAQALFFAGNLNACINVLEKNLQNPLENEVLLMQSGLSTVSAVGASMEHESPDRGGLTPDQQEELSYYRGLRFLLLARSYEAQENKNYAVLFYKEALRHNGASYEAFNRLISNHLLTREEKRSLLLNNATTGEDGGCGVIQKGLEGRPEDLWLKDYYQSRID
jgi:hypothetical protein